MSVSYFYIITLLNSLIRHTFIIFAHLFSSNAAHLIWYCDAKIEHISVINKFFTEKIAVIKLNTSYMVENQTIKERLIAFIAYLGIGQGKFEKECGMANGYVNNIRKSISPEKLQQIALRYPQLNAGWLMTGDGEMIKNGVSQNANGDNNTQIAGNGNNVNSLPTLDKALNEISEMRKLLEKAIQNNKEQADRFFAIIEKMQGV